MTILQVCRNAPAIAVVVLLVSILALSPPAQLLQGLSLDVLTALRWRLVGERQDPTQSPTVVVALDQATYETPPFRGTPTVVWTREIGKVLTAVVDAGAAVVGFDLIFPSSIEESDLPFGQETFGSHNRGFDRDFLRALGIAARTGKVVLAEFSGVITRSRLRQGNAWLSEGRTIYAQSTYSSTPTGLCEGCRC